MMSILSEGFFGEKLYAVIAAMRFAANPPMLLWRVCSIWTMFFNSSFIVSINNLSPSRILSRRCINEFFMFLHMRVIRWRQKTKNSGRALRVRVGGWGGRQVHFRKRLLVVGGALQVLDKPKDGSEQQKTLHQTKTKVWNIKSSVLQKDCLILHLSVDSTGTKCNAKLKKTRSTLASSRKSSTFALVNKTRYHGRAVRHRSAKPATAVRICLVPLRNEGAALRVAPFVFIFAAILSLFISWKI